MSTVFVQVTNGHNTDINAQIQIQIENLASSFQSLLLVNNCVTYLNLLFCATQVSNSESIQSCQKMTSVP